MAAWCSTPTGPGPQAGCNRRWYARSRCRGQGQVEALLKRFRGFASAPLSSDAAGPAAGGAGAGDITQGGAPSAAMAVSRGDLRLLSCFIPVICIRPRGGVKLSFGIARTICFVIFASRFCNFLPIRFAFCISRARPRAYLNHHWADRRPGWTKE